MADNNNKVSEILREIVGELKSVASTQTVVGEPITLGDKTVIPLVKISLGFGAGGGQGESPDKGGGFGGGGGGAAKIEPSAFIIIDEDKVSMLSASPGKLDSLIEAVPSLFNKIKGARDKMKSDDKGEKSEESESKEEGPESGHGHQPY